MSALEVFMKIRNEGRKNPYPKDSLNYARRDFQMAWEDFCWEVMKELKIEKLTELLSRLISWISKRRSL